jgi:hypothetical protein
VALTLGAFDLQECMVMDKSGRRVARLRVVAAGVSVLATGVGVAAGYEGTADDYSQISQLMTRYSYTLDNHDPQGWAGVFTEDGLFRAAQFCLVGRKQMADLVEKQNARPPPADAATRPKTHHINENRSIEFIDRDNAIAHSFVMVVADVGRDHVGGGIQVTGTYDDKLKRVRGHWLIADRLEVSPGDGPPLPCPPPAN